MEREEEEAFYRQQVQGMLDPYIGMGKGAAHTSLGISRFLGAVPPETTLGDIGISEPTNQLQRMGYTTEQILEFVGGGGAARGAIRGIGGRGILAGGLAEGVGAGTVSMAQTGDPRAASFDAALDSILTVGFGAAGKGLKYVGRRAMRTAINPSRVDINQGFDVENIFKYNLEGTLPQMARKVNARMSELSNDLRASIAKHGDVEIDLYELIQNAEKEMRASGAKYSFQIAEMGPAVEKVFGAIAAFMPDFAARMKAGLPLTVGLSDAQSFKQAVGLLGSFTKSFPDVNPQALEMFADALYTQLRKAVEVGAPEVRAINKQLSELIPINDAVIRALPDAAKKRMLELGELILISGAAESMLGDAPIAKATGSIAGLILISKMLRSTIGGSAFYYGGEASDFVTPVAGRLAAGLTDSPLTRLGGAPPGMDPASFQNLPPEVQGQLGRRFFERNPPDRSDPAARIEGILPRRRRGIGGPRIGPLGSGERPVNRDELLQALQRLGPLG
jgi:hypothetical protein